jgi:hypothetical protein
VANEDGNYQEMSVHDKTHPTLAPTEEAQDVSKLNRIVVPLPAFMDPGNPAAASGSVNLTLDKHPVEHSTDYGQQVDLEVGADKMEGTMDRHAPELKELDTTQDRVSGDDGTSEALPEDREEWSKANWQSQARTYGLGVSGNMDALRQRVEDYENEREDDKSLTAGDWKALVDEAEDTEELQELQDRYQATGNSYSTVDSAFEAKNTEFNES